MTTNQTLTPEEFAQAAAALAAAAEAVPLGQRAQYLDKLGDLWVAQGHKALGQTWYDAAAYARRTYGG